MRKLLLSGVATTAFLATSFAANAADLAPSYKAPPPVPYFSWTGIYIGGHAGGAWGRKDWEDPLGFFGVFPFPFAHGNRDHQGFIAGGQIGANYQFGKWVIGVEADFSWTDLDGHSKCTDVLIFACHT